MGLSQLAREPDRLVGLGRGHPDVGEDDIRASGGRRRPAPRRGRRSSRRPRAPDRRRGSARCLRGRGSCPRRGRPLIVTVTPARRVRSAAARRARRRQERDAGPGVPRVTGSSSTANRKRMAPDDLPLEGAPESSGSRCYKRQHKCLSPVPGDDASLGRLRMESSGRAAGGRTHRLDPSTTATEPRRHGAYARLPFRVTPEPSSHAAGPLDQNVEPTRSGRSGHAGRAPAPAREPQPRRRPRLDRRLVPVRRHRSGRRLDGERARPDPERDARRGPLDVRARRHSTRGSAAGSSASRSWRPCSTWSGRARR